MLQEVGTHRIFRQLAHEGGKVVSPKHQPAAFAARRYPWYLFLLEAESTPEPKCGWKDQVIEDIQSQVDF
jgi:hypothetical protein